MASLVLSIERLITFDCRSSSKQLVKACAVIGGVLSIAIYSCYFYSYSVISAAFLRN